MDIEPIEFADFGLVEVRTANDCRPTPHCKKHGAMNKTTKDGIWRCITVAGYEIVGEGRSRGEKHRENICRAGCIEKKTEI